MKIKKGIFTILILLLTSVLSYAQFMNCKLADIEKLKQSAIVVAISNDAATNRTVQEIMASYWTASKFSVIKRSELEAYMNVNPENYVVTYLSEFGPHDFYTIPAQMKAEMEKVEMPTQIIGDCLILAKNLTKVSGITLTDAMVNCYVDYEMHVVSEQAEFTRQIGAINAMLTLPNLQDSQIGGWKIPTISQKDMINKKLWIAAIDINKKEELAKMKEAYQPYNYEIVTKEDIAKAIIEKRTDIVYLAREEYKWKINLFIIHQALDNKILFFVKEEGCLDSIGLEQIKSNKPYQN